jgi:hypothetical protein
MRITVNAPHVVGEIIDGEAVVVNLRDGAYYSMTGVGATIWAFVEQGATADQIVESLSGQYPEEAGVVRGAVDSFLSRLAGEDLIREEPGTAPELGEASANGEPFADPVFEKFEDLKDLLLIDPIHEVDETGWPLRVGDPLPPP